MVFLVCSIVNPFKFSLANFVTKDFQASQIFPLLWKAVGICKLTSLKVITITWDGASPNRKLFKTHFHLKFDVDINPDVDVTYGTRNIHSLKGKSFIYFISDAPNLLKSTLNCLYKIGSGKYTWYM